MQSRIRKRRKQEGYSIGVQLEVYVEAKFLPYVFMLKQHLRYTLPTSFESFFTITIKTLIAEFLYKSFNKLYFIRVVS